MPNSSSSASARLHRRRAAADRLLEGGAHVGHVEGDVHHAVAVRDEPLALGVFLGERRGEHEGDLALAQDVARLVPAPSFPGRRRRPRRTRTRCGRRTRSAGRCRRRSGRGRSCEGGYLAWLNPGELTTEARRHREDKTRVFRTILVCLLRVICVSVVVACLTAPECRTGAPVLPVRAARTATTGR